jgi:hypothetical protein
MILRILAQQSPDSELWLKNMDEKSYRGKVVISGGSGGIFEIYKMSGGPWYERQGHMRNL